MVAERSNMAGLPEILSQRARRHRTLTPDEEARINANLQMRVKDLLDSWWKVAKKQQEFGARLVYQRYEQSEGKALLRMPLEPADPDLGQDARRFKAPRSLRDVEPSVNLFVQRLDGTAVEMPSEGDAS